MSCLLLVSLQHIPRSPQTSPKNFGLFGVSHALLACRAVGPALCSLSISPRLLRKGSWWTACGWVCPDVSCDAAVENCIPVPGQACNRKSQPEGKAGTLLIWEHNSCANQNTFQRRREGNYLILHHAARCPCARAEGPGLCTAWKKGHFHLDKEKNPGTYSLQTPSIHIG